MKTEMKSAGLLFLTAAIWGFAMAAQREASAYLSPMTFNACRFTVGAAAMGPLLAMEKKGKGRIGRRDVLSGCALGAVLFTASLLQQMGVGAAGAGKAGFLTALYVVLVPVLGAMMGKKTRGSTWLALGIAIPALYLLCVPKGEKLRLAPADGAVLAGAVFWAAHILLTDAFTKRTAALRLCVIQFASAAVMNWAGAIFFEKITRWGLSYALVPVLYCGIMSTGIGYLCQTVGQRGCRPALAALIMSLESVFCVAAGALLLGEKMDGRGLAGCALMLLAVVLAQAGAWIAGPKEETHV